MKEHTKQMPGKSHDTTIKLGEGLEVGSKHPAHTKHKVMDAKDNRAPHVASHAQRNRVLSGNGNTQGEGEVKPYTGHAAYHSENPAAIKSSRDQRESAIAGNADAEGEQPVIHHHNNTPGYLK
jgi:hypothetical protein